MPALRFTGFAGERPILSPYKLPRENAVLARDVRLWSGALYPLKSAVDVQATAAGSTSIFRYQNTPDKWFEWTPTVHAVRSPAPNDSFDRVYYTGTAGEPKVTDATRALSGTPYPGADLRIGVAIPAAAPTLTVSGTANLAAGARESRFYVTTYFNTYGEEGPPSDVSAEVEVDPGQTVTVDLPAAPTGNYDTAGVRVYRLNTGGGNAQYQYVGEETIGTATFVDNVASASLNEALGTTDWDEPPDDIEGLIGVSDYLAAFRRNQVLLCEPGLPHAWPVAYRQSTDAPIVALGALPNGFVACTTGQPFVFSGGHPAALQAIDSERPYPCVSAAGVVSVGGQVVYPSTRGLVAVSTAGASVISASVFDLDDWNALVPSSIKAFVWRDLYVAFYDTGSSTGGFVFDPSSPSHGVVSLSPRVVDGGYADPMTDELFVVEGGQIRQWAAASGGSFAWQSRPEELTRPSAMSVLQVFADAYPVTVTIRREGEFQAKVVIGGPHARRVPNSKRAQDYDVKIESSGEVREVVLATTMEELKEV